MDLLSICVVSMSAGVLGWGVSTLYGIYRRRKIEKRIIQGRARKYLHRKD